MLESSLPRPYSHAVLLSPCCKAQQPSAFPTNQLSRVGGVRLPSPQKWGPRLRLSLCLGLSAGMFTPHHNLYNQGSVSVIISELHDSVNHQQLTWVKQPSIQAEETWLPYINITQSNQEKIMCGRGSQFQRLVTVPALTQMHRQMSDRQMTHPFINYSYMCNSFLRSNSHMFTERFRGLSHIHRLCKHSCYHFWKILIAPRRNPMPISTHFSLFWPPALSSQPQTTMAVFSSLCSGFA